MQKANGKIFSALKMIESLYLDNKIRYIIFRNILNDYQDIIDLSEFSCYTDSHIKAKCGNM